MRTEQHQINGSQVTYKVSEDGTYYDSETPDSLIEILERARINKTRLKFYLGDKETGKDWMEEDSKLGKIGRSTGQVKIPIIIKNVYSCGGEAILTDCIVKLTTSPGRVPLYQHPKYHQPKMEILEDGDGKYSHAIIIGGDVYSRHTSLLSAKRLFSKLS